MNWNYSSADFEDSLYETVQGPEEGKGRDDGKVYDEHARDMGADDQKAYGSRVREWAREQGSVYMKHGAKREESGGKIRRTNVQVGIEKSKHRYENVIDLPSVPMPGGSNSNGEQDECGEREAGKNCDVGEAGLEALNSLSEAVDEAIANVAATCRDGEDRLVRVLEDLEHQVLAEKSEEDELMLQVQQLYEPTPRRSVRLARKKGEPMK